MKIILLAAVLALAGFACSDSSDDNTDPSETEQSNNEGDNVTVDPKDGEKKETEAENLDQSEGKQKEEQLPDDLNGNTERKPFGEAIKNTGMIALKGTEATGYASLSNFQNEESCTPSSENKAFPYPCYELDDGTAGSGKYIIAEPLSAASEFVEESTHTILNRDRIETDDDFAEFSLGSISYDQSLITGEGSENISVSDLELDIVAPELDPFTSERNIRFRNEFAWSYSIIAKNIKGEGLTFSEGLLTSIDISADLVVDVLLFAQMSNKFVFDTASGSLEQEQSLIIDDANIRFQFDQTADAQTFLGSVTDVRVSITRAGTITP